MPRNETLNPKPEAPKKTRKHETERGDAKDLEALCLGLATVLAPWPCTVSVQATAY